MRGQVLSERQRNESKFEEKLIAACSHDQRSKLPQNALIMYEGFKIFMDKFHFNSVHYIYRVSSPLKRKQCTHWKQILPPSPDSPLMSFLVAANIKDSTQPYHSP
jgi:hypothetical protein